MSVLIAPAVSAVAGGLLNQSAAIRARKLASDIAQAQAGNNLADQSYLMVVQRSGQTPPTRYEYDKAVAPYNTAIQTGDINTLRSVGLWTDAYIADVAARHPQPFGPQMLPQPYVPAPPGSQAQMPAMGPGPPFGPSAGMPGWVIPAGLAAAGLFALSFFMGKKKRS
jgi:hypothetical protein